MKWNYSQRPGGLPCCTPSTAGPGAPTVSSIITTAAQWVTYAVAVAGVLVAAWRTTRRVKTMATIS
ncbi:MAG: hypothetical protein M3Q12_11140 [Pseudomonadota bacterium]|uniref:hypothetical protein n=1 Tax=Polaromonas sp. TaxID=1869339 RepID=UPI0017E6D137|nr:hypothetical protein [Polaromonas sp.]MBA3594715.1 hypothetical protein [Polaromonas sp.]MDQ3272702.1 hypothetical protein [Pseudomonadota bacterium]